MLPSPHTVVLLLALAATLIVLWAVGWRILLLARPGSIRILPATPEDAQQALSEAGFQAITEALAEEGFVFIGARLEHPRLGKPVVNADFGSPQRRAFASAFRARSALHLYLLTPVAGGGVVRTGVAAKSGAGGYTAQAMKEPLSAALTQHLALCQTAAREGAYDAGERLALARAWFAGAGAPAVRREQVAPVLWSLLTLGMVLWTLLIHL